MHEQAYAHLSGGTAPYDIYTSRKEDFTEDISIGHADFTGASFTAVIADHPDGTQLLSLDVSAVTTETKTYQQWIDDCVITQADIPCSYTSTDNMVVSTLTLSKSQTNIDILPRAERQGGLVKLYWSLTQTAPEVDMIAAGHFTLSETA